MKKFLIVLIAVALAATLFVSCESLARGALEGAVGAAAGGVPAAGSAAAASSSVAAVDFQSADILCGDGVGSMFDSPWGVARVLTPASTASKNQAEVLWVNNGAKEWVNYVITSRKATKADMVVGAPVFVNTYIGESTKSDADTYRKGSWWLRTVTSADNLFKGLVEANGDFFTVDFCRVPIDPVK
ncbi:MAG: hypothetical protein NT080_02165 [Spirochaetes bacterium]|nr:hypothetical protein [Spirochaetota bacterium]